MANDRQVALTIDNTQVDSSLTNFPVLLTRAELPDEMCDPSGSNAARTDGGDIRVYSDASQTTEYAREIVTFEHDSVTAAGDAVVEIWVLVPSVSSASDTTFYLEYGDGALTDYAVGGTYGRNAVWADYEFVSHMDNTSPTDSTGNYTVNTGNVAAAAADRYSNSGEALDFDGTNDYYYLDYTRATDSRMTIQCWLNKDAGSADRVVHLASDGTVNTGFLMIAVDGSSANNVVAVAREAPTGTSVETAAGAALSDNTWALVHAIGNPNDASTDPVDGYLNGVAMTDTGLTGWGAGGSDKLTIGTRSDFASVNYNGRVDEVRWRPDALSAAWIDAEYNNQKTSSTFISAGTPSAVGGGGNTDESISIGLSAGVASSSTAAAGGSISVGLSAGVADQSQSAALGGLSLAMQTGVAFAGAASALDSLSIGLSAGVAFAQEAGAQGTLNLGLSHGQSLATTSAAVAALSFGIGHGLAISVSTSGAVEESISLGIASGIAASAVSSTSGALTLSFDIGLGFLTGQQVDEAISLGLISGITGSGTAQAIASVTVDIDAQTAAQAQSSAIGAITIGQAIGQAIATSVGGIVTPDSRTISVSGQTRTVTVDADGRTITVRSQTRIIEV